MIRRIGTAAAANRPDPGRRERGSAVIEFCYLALVLMVPLTYVVLVVFAVQGAGYAVTQATREAGRAYVTADRPEEAEARAYAAAWLALHDHGLTLEPGQLRIECDAPTCLRPGGRISVRIDTSVPLPFAPPVLAGQAPASVAIHGRHEEIVDLYRAIMP